MDKKEISKYYSDLMKELEKILNNIKDEIDVLLNLKKPVVTSEAKYSTRITSCIMRYCNKNRPIKNFEEIKDYYFNRENMEYEYDQILELNYFINCEKSIDYIMNKKTLCMILGISINQYQDFMCSFCESSEVFKNIEETLISIKQESAENYNRNAMAIDNNLKTKGKYGGHDVEMVYDKQEKNNDKKFDVLNASFEEISNRLKSKYNITIPEENKG